MENNLRRDFSSPTPQANPGRKKVVAPVERDGKTFWLRVGAAFENRDRSWNLYLDAFPVSGKLQLRDWDEPWEGRGRAGATGAGTMPLPALAPGDLPRNDNLNDLSEPF